MKTVVAFFDVTEFDRASLARLLKNAPEIEGHFYAEELNESSAKKIKNADCVSIFITSDITEQVLAALPNLKHIVCRSTGFNHVPLEATDKKGITVTNVPTYGEHTVAEYTYALLLSLARKIPQAINATKSGSMEHAGLTGFDLAEKTMGVVGTGHIGCQVAKIGIGFGMKVIAYDPHANNEVALKTGFSYRSLDELLSSADVVSLHTPYLKSTHHLLNGASIAKLKRGSYIINTARGELIDTAALVAALQSGHVAGAALDVLESEELIEVQEEMLILRRKDKQKLELAAEHAVLLKMPNVIVTNHNAFNSKEALERINATSIENIKSFLLGNPQNKVNK